MRRVLFLVPALLLACSAPKYTYYFDHYNYQSGKKLADNNTPPVFPAKPCDDLLVADASGRITLVDPVSTSLRENKLASPNEVSKERTQQIPKISKEQRKEIRNELKAQMKQFRKNASSNTVIPAHTNAMDKDLKFAIIFGAIGLTLSLFSGISPAFWVLGVIAIVVGVVFLVRWLLRQ